MKKSMNIARYAVCMLYGVFTADMIYRTVRFIMAYTGAAEEYPKILGVVFAAVGDTYSGYMTASIAVALLLTATGVLCRAYSRYTVVFLVCNIVSGFIFVAILNFVNVSWRVLLATAAASFGTYILSCVLCEVSVACDIYKNILKNHFRENNQ